MAASSVNYMIFFLPGERANHEVTMPTFSINVSYKFSTKSHHYGLCNSVIVSISGGKLKLMGGGRKG